jgi:hypothetical protein
LREARCRYGRFEEPFVTQFFNQDGEHAGRDRFLPVIIGAEQAGLATIFFTRGGGKDHHWQ